MDRRKLSAGDRRALSERVARRQTQGVDPAELGRELKRMADREASRPHISKRDKVQARAFFDIEKQRDRCSMCRQKQDWYRLDGSGRCVLCQP